MDDRHISKDDLSWHLYTRRFRSVVHSGFGLGLEKLVQFKTRMKNITDVIFFARTPWNYKYQFTLLSSLNNCSRFSFLSFLD